MTDWLKEFGVDMTKYSGGADQVWVRDMLTNKRAKSVGLYGETWAAAELERAGYVVSRAKEGDKRGDLLAVDTSTGEMIRVEIKTSKRGSDGIYRFCIERRIGARVCTSAHHSDFLILLAVTKPGTVYPFVIPVTDGLPKSISMSGHPAQYTGKYARFRQRGALTLEKSC
jgi:Holliday junction resolvase-like predicted endonuclease